ncbi:hypothetical protein [Bradyrhizobium sp. B117]|uniref:hypothetical protein n=1 Tax=Bradyrhizobium sp. B117 TaxID=3140246 RepID=UPI0031846A0B
MVMMRFVTDGSDGSGEAIVMPMEEDFQTGEIVLTPWIAILGEVVVQSDGINNTLGPAPSLRHGERA